MKLYVPSDGGSGDDLRSLDKAIEVEDNRISRQHFSAKLRSSGPRISPGDEPDEAQCKLEDSSTESSFAVFQYKTMPMRLRVLSIPLPAQQHRNKPKPQTQAKTLAGGIITGLNGLKIEGHFKFVQLSNNAGVSIDLAVEGLDQKFKAKDDINYHIHEKPATKDCSGLGAKLVDLSKDHKPLKGVKINKRSFVDHTLSLFPAKGKTNIVGRSITIHDGTTIKYLGCATILV
ncbi:uncharacterized protein MELLADRAFT_114193 [Melampsora larici-populina 98AG31]|uniref:Superoxide dismutase copper/zinc binding domain-containing protein n=1 Tax=Melampsora larici-populina (strain 98AG31 / pathotype 3-4-7) TaxID=747676 RepID=F4SCJ8_MELLP|nr:uncharacterized protein MELLADRAFT_114193 [Melampsora larici-populina 98AG31]EGF97628.1 hypothetical protein MELLADRAFT_114193 [Melampsora larici-populina 98AG31]